MIQLPALPRWQFAALLGLLLAPLAAHAGDPIADRFLTSTLSTNPGVASTRLQWESLSQHPTIAGALPDPELTYGYYFESVQTRTGAMRQRVGLRQKIPFPGKLKTAREEARWSAEIAYWQYRAALRDVFARGRLLLADLYRRDALILILREQQNLLQQTAEAAEVAIETNEGSLGDVIRAQVAAEEIATRIAQLEAERTGVLARMQALQGETGSGPALTRYSAPELPTLPDLDSLLARASSSNPDLEAARTAVDRDEAAIRLAALAYYPDFTLGLEYTQITPNIISPTTSQNGNDPIMATLSLNLPIWWDKLEAQQAAAVAQHGSSQARHQQLTADITADVRAAHAMARSMQQQRSRYANEIVPGARQAYESAQSAYAAGTSSLTDLLDIQRAYLSAELGLIERTAGYLRTVAELERALGEPLHHSPAKP